MRRMQKDADEDMKLEEETKQEIEANEDNNY